MTYDQWKTTPPDECWGYLCAGCDAINPAPHDYCGECAAARAEDEALMRFYQWEPL